MNVDEQNDDENCQSVDRVDVESVQDCESEPSNPPKKPKHNDFSPQAIEARKSFMTNLIVENINNFYGTTNRSELTDIKFTAENVKIEFDSKTKVYTVEIFCYECRAFKSLPVSSNGYHTIMFRNFKKHFTTLHIEKGPIKFNGKQLSIKESFALKNSNPAGSSSTSNNAENHDNVEEIVNVEQLGEGNDA